MAEILPTTSKLVYTTTEFAVKSEDEYEKFMEVVRSILKEVGENIGLTVNVHKSEVTFHPEQGWRMRYAVRGNRELADFILMAMGVEDYTASILTTELSQPPGDNWPSDAAVLEMYAAGFSPQYVAFVIPPAFPISLIRNLIGSALQDRIEKAGVSWEDSIRGFSSDQTSLGLFTATYYVSDDFSVYLAQDPIDSEVSQRIGALLDNQDFTDWIDEAFQLDGRNW